ADPSPYAPLSAFALDPVYLSLDACDDFKAAGGRDALPSEARDWLEAHAGTAAVDLGRGRAIKRAGVALAFARFLRDEGSRDTPRAHRLAAFMKGHAAWLDDYALFVSWHDRFGTSWLDWPAGPRDRDPGAIAAWRHEARDEILKLGWVQ